MEETVDYKTSKSVAPTPNIYFGNFQEKSHKSGDKFLPGVINLTKLLDELGYEVVKKKKNLKDFIHVSKRGDEFLKVVVNPFIDGANEYGNTHNIKIDKIRPDDSTIKYL
jgi:hypothetical protein